MKLPHQRLPSVLVVDDTRVNRLVLEAKLAKRDYLVTLAEGGREALEQLGIADDSEAGPLRFDVVILDIMMPEIDGLQVLEILRKTWDSIELPVIMVTAKSQSEDIVQALQAGANDYVTKPIDMPVLLARLATQVALKQSHEALKVAQRSLIDAAKMETVGLLAAGVAHEIRNPLAQMQLAADGLSASQVMNANENARTFCEVIQGAVEQADSIVRRLMEFSRTARLDLQEMELNPLIKETLGLFEEDFSNYGVSVEPRLSDGTGTAKVSKTEFCQVLINIVMNALQAMKGGGNLTVTSERRILEGRPADEGARSGIRLRNGDEVCVVEIEDTGTGIPEENLDLVFDAFFTTRPTGSGSGLGLSVARKVIDLHGGLLDVTNRREGQGVKVVISLPISGGFQTMV